MESPVPNLTFMESQPSLLLRAGKGIPVKQMDLSLLYTATPDKIPLNFVDVFIDFGGKLNIMLDIGGDADQSGFG